MQAPFVPFHPDDFQPGIVATIDLQTCIGCTKCLPVCPTDAIVGSGKTLHLVLQEDCTGCGQCVAACPVDCIQLIPDSRSSNSEQQQAQLRRLTMLGEKRLQRWQNELQTAAPVRIIDTKKQQYLEEIAAARTRVEAKKQAQQSYDKK